MAAVDRLGGGVGHLSAILATPAHHERRIKSTEQGEVAGRRSIPCQAALYNLRNHHDKRTAVLQKKPVATILERHLPAGTS